MRDIVRRGAAVLFVFSLGSCSEGSPPPVPASGFPRRSGAPTVAHPLAASRRGGRARTSGVSPEDASTGVVQWVAGRPPGRHLPPGLDRTVDHREGLVKLKQFLLSAKNSGDFLRNAGAAGRRDGPAAPRDSGS